MQRHINWTKIYTAFLCLTCTTPLHADVVAVYPQEGTLGTEVTLTGSGFGEKRGKIYLGDQRCRIVSWGDTEITCQVVIPQPAGEYSFSVLTQTGKKSSEPMLFSSFNLRAPWISPGDPLRLVTPGELVTIAGDFFGDRKGEVYLHDTTGQTVPAKVRDWDMDSVSFEIPEGLTGTLILGVLNEIGLGIQRFWGTLTPLPPSTTTEVDHSVASAHNNASGVYYNGRLWVFYAEPNKTFDKENDIHPMWYTNGTFVSAPQCGGTTDAQVVPLVIAHELWLFHTGEAGGMYYKRFIPTSNKWEDSWHRIGSIVTDHNREIAPVYNPIQKRIEVYYWYNNTIYWVFSTDGGANWIGKVPVTGLTRVETSPSAVFYQQSEISGVTLLCVGVGYAGGIYPAVFSVRDGAIVDAVVKYPGPTLYGRPFLADLGEDYFAMTWVAADDTAPYIQKIDKKTGAWRTYTTAVAHASDWRPNMLVNYEQQDDTGSLGTRWDAILYLLWGRKTSSGTTAVMSSIESLGFWREITSSPTVTDLSSDMAEFFHMWPVLGVIDAPPFIQNGEEITDDPEDPVKATRVVFGTETVNTAKSETSMKLGPYVETGEKSHLKMELSASVAEKMANEVTTKVILEATLYRSLAGRVGVYYLAPELQVHQVQWNNPDPTTNYMYPVIITPSTSGRFLIFDPTEFPVPGAFGMQATYFDLQRFPVHQEENDWERLGTFTAPAEPSWFDQTIDWSLGGDEALAWVQESSTSQTSSFSLEFKVGVNIKKRLGFGMEGSFEAQTETTTTVTTESKLWLCNPWRADWEDPVPDQISHFSVHAKWLSPNESGFWVPLNRRGLGDQPWFITYGVGNVW